MVRPNRTPEDGELNASTLRVFISMTYYAQQYYLHIQLVHTKWWHSQQLTTLDLTFQWWYMGPVVNIKLGIGGFPRLLTV